MDAAIACVAANERGALFADIAAGDYLPVVQRLLRAALVTAHPLPADVITAVDSWLDRYEGARGQPAVRQLLARHGWALQAQHARADTGDHHG